MTKTLKGLSARSFTTSSTEDFISGRNLFLSQPVASMAGLSFAVGGASTLVESQSSIADENVELGGGKQLPDVPILSCLSEKGLILQLGVDNYLANIHQISGDISVPSTIADEGTLNVIVGGSVSGVLDNPADHDTATVFLISGQVYMISVRGTGATPAADVFINILNPSAVNVGHDDDGGNDLNSLFTFTAAATGNYSIDISSANPAADVGGYTVDVRVRGVDAVGNSNATAVHLDPGTIFGFRETGSGSSGVAGTPAGDLDRYSVDLVAGHFYTFKLAGGSDYETGYYLPQTASNMDTIMYLRNAAGTIVASNDDVGFPDDLSSGLGFYATVSGTYYLDAAAYSGYTGGYSIEFQDVDFASLDPLDSIDWESAANVPFVDVAGVPTAYVYFAAAGDTFGEPGVSYGWNAFEQQQFMLALEEYEHILGTNYEITTDVNQATFRVFTTTSTQFGAYFYPQDPGFGDAQGIGAFNVDSGGWNKPGASSPAYPIGQESLDRGGYSFAVMLHELGHAHGQAHPHDNGGGSDIMAGVTAATGSYGIFNLNQGVYTVMSYNDSWDFHPDGPSPFTLTDINHGWSATLGAFDIAELQIRYGVHDYNTGDNVYTLIDVIESAFYECIWDSGGTDAIAYGGTLNAVIDLTAATLDYSPTGGGVISFLDNGAATTTLRGGFTIANGVVIENATGGTGNDTLIGNSAANALTGNNGADNFVGRGGDDILHGGAGTDTAYYDGNRADYTITAIITGGVITGFTVKDDNIAAPANSNNPIMVANEGTDTLDGVESLDFADAVFSLAGTVAVFDGDGALVSMHTTIQAAINAATTLDGYRIFASAGTYAEDVNVTKDVTIEGANVGVAGDDTRGAETSVKSFTISVDGVTINGVEVTGSSNSAGVYVNAGSDDFSLVNSVLNGMTDAYGVLTGQVEGLDVTDNLLVGYGIGMYVSGGESTGEIHSNIFQGGGLEAVPATTNEGLYNGIILETSHVTVSDNTFDDMYYSSIVITPFGPDTVDLATFITGNDYPGTLAERVIFVYPTNDTHNVLGTDDNEGFDAETAQLATGSGGYGYTSASTSFDGRGGDDYAWGGELADTFIGGSGSDQLFGKGGDDSLTGGTDNDLIDGGTGIDTAHIGGTLSYVDTVVGWAITSSADGTDFVQNTEIVVDGGGHRNLLVRGSGYATLQAALTGAATGDNVRLATGNYTGTVNYSVNGLTVIAQPGAVQNNLTYATASAFGITVLAASGADTITGSANNDVLNGGGGADVLNGGAGADYLDGGGAGVAHLNGGSGNDTIIVDADDLVGEAVGGGFDNVAAKVSYILNAGAEVEILSTTNHAGTAAINLNGNEFGQIVVGNAGNNYIDGGSGADILDGLGGNDTIIVDADDLVYEAVGGGFDNVAAKTSFVLNSGAEIEILSTTNHGGTGAINLTGNEFGQGVVGNAGANVLDGGLGSDSLVGLGGADTFAFTTALGSGNVDTIADFLGGTDKIALDDAVFTGLTPGALPAGAFVVGTAAADADDRIIYDSNTGALYFDADGNGVGAMVQFATLTGLPVLTASDFLVI